ncbi:MAG: hypothetical protein VB835_02240 [Pirellulales bacterium]
MSTPANVSSVAAIRTFKAALQIYIDTADDALLSMKMELERSIAWLQHDRPAHWKRQVQDSWTRVSDARATLSRARMRIISGQRPSCIDEQKALDKANHDVKHAEEMTEVTRTWCQNMQHETLEYAGQLSHLVTMYGVELPQAVESLDRIIGSLEAYSAVQLPTTDAAAPQARASIARGIEKQATTEMKQATAAADADDDEPPLSAPDNN